MNTSSIVNFFLIVFFCLTALSCDKGLEPTSPSSGSQSKPYGLSGVVYFKNWPPQDSVLDLRLVAFLDSLPGNIFNAVLNGRARYTEKLQPFGTDSIAYTLLLAPLSPGRIPFIAVGQQFGSNLSTDWRLVGVYYANGDTTKPGAVDVPSDAIVNNINIKVDFRNPPPQP